MGKKKTYYDYLRQELGELVEQLELSPLYKQSLKQRWLDQTVWADKKAAECRRWHYRLRLTTIIGGVILPALVGINFEVGKNNVFFRTWFPYLPFALSQVIAISAAIEEFCRFGDRWRDYRQMSENLKAEGWQYLQLTGPYENNPSHTKGYPLFASRVESIIKDDVQNYVADLIKQQAKQEQKIEQYLESAQAVTQDKTLFAPPQPTYRPGMSNGATVSGAVSVPGTMLGSMPTAVMEPAIQGASPYGGMGGMANPLIPAVAATLATAAVGAAGMLRTRQNTVFKLSPQSSETLPEHQKIAIGAGQSFGLQACVDGGSNHLYVTLAQGVGIENRNIWYVYAPHVEILDPLGQPVNPVVTAPTPAPVGSPPTAAPEIAAPVTAAPTANAALSVSRNGAIKLPVPYFSQRDNVIGWERTCNTSSCAMVAKYLGAKIAGDDEYYQYVIKYGDTTDHNAQTQALTEIGIKSTWNTNLDFDDLDKSLGSGLPIVIGILHHGSLEAPRGGGHMLVVIGRNEQGDYIVNDPYGDLMSEYTNENGENLIYSRQVLKCRWTVEGKNTGYGRLFYDNPVANATAPAAKPAANLGIPAFPVQSLQTSLPSGLKSQSSGAIPQCGIDLIKHFEGYEEKLPDGRARAYADSIHGWSVPTIGYGTTAYPDGRKVQQGDIITHEQAEQYLIAHIESECKSKLEKIPHWGRMNEKQRGAIYSFAYNLGAGFYGNPDFKSMTQVCDSPEQWNNYAWIEEQFVKYRNPGTSSEAGLRARRVAEAKLFCS